VIELFERARTYCRKGLGSHEELFQWEVLLFYWDMLNTSGRVISEIKAPLESLRLCAAALAEYQTLFGGDREENPAATLKPFAFFGIVSTTVESLDAICKTLSLPETLIQETKRSDLWDARNNFVHVHRDRTGDLKDDFAIFKRHEFRIEGFSREGFRYSSRPSSGSGFGIRFFGYDNGLEFLIWRMTQVFAECRAKISAEQEVGG
jgi:hypothetical protein